MTRTLLERAYRQCQIEKPLVVAYHPASFVLAISSRHPGFMGIREDPNASAHFDSGF